MPALRRSGPTDVQLAAAERVRSLLRPSGGWVPPPLPGDGAGEQPADLPAPVDQVPPAAAPEPPATAPQPPGAAPPGVLDRLRSGRLDPGRPAVLGLGVVALLACLLAAVVVLRSAPEQVALPEVEAAGVPVAGSVVPGAGATPTPPSGEVVVAVAGTVRRPGLVRLPAGSRVDDAVRAAGGVTPGASPGLLNLARRLVDGEQVLVGVEAPPGAGPAPAAPSGEGAGLVDLNTASAAELDGLPGIGPVLAERIVEHRTRNGPFRSVDQLREVSGIGESKYASLRDAVTV